jgi:hypothetical protein
MIRRTKFDTHWEALNAARAALGLAPSTAGDARRSYAAAMRAASASGYLRWLSACDDYLAVMGQRPSARDEALRSWRNGLDADEAARLLTSQRTATHDSGWVRLAAIVRSLPDNEP